MVTTPRLPARRYRKYRAAERTIRMDVGHRRENRFDLEEWGK